MSYDATPFYERENFLKNRLDALLKPPVGILSERNAPGYLRNDIATEEKAKFHEFNSKIYS
jgi:hypothetical protein